MLNKVPRDEDVSYTSLSTIPSRSRGEWRYSSMHS